MRAVIQRVSQASVSINEAVTGRIGPGLVVFVGIEESDTSEDIKWLSGKIVSLRIFADEQGVMNLPVSDVSGDILVVSQFTRKKVIVLLISGQPNLKLLSLYMRNFYSNWRLILAGLCRKVNSAP